MRLYACLFSWFPSWCGVLWFLATSSLAHASIPVSVLKVYADGLDALSEARWTNAVAAFSKALEIDGDHPELVLARGVARTLAEEFVGAQKDLVRAQRLGITGREVLLWIFATEAMSGSIVVPDHALGGSPRSLRSQEPVVVSIPGHVAQGGADYTTDYGSFIVYRLAMEYQKHRLPPDLGGSGDLKGLHGTAIRQALLKAGQLFAERNYQRPELAAINVNRARKSSAGGSGGSAAEALVFAERALAAKPGDAEARYQAGMAWLNAGHPVTARRQFTMALTVKTDFAEAYLARALAAAHMGDEKRALADLEIHDKLTRSTPAKEIAAIHQNLRAIKVNDSVESLRAQLEALSRSPSTSALSWEKLSTLASQLHRAAGGRRLRYDEVYQDRLRVLEDGVRANPRNPDKRVELAAHLIAEADNRSETLEPRREPQFYRFQESREKELLRAVDVADQALALKAKHVEAILQKATALTALKRYEQADALAEEALGLASKHPDALRLYAKFRAMRANQLSGEAWGLRQERCTSSSHDETRGDGIYRVTTTTCIPPSEGDVRRAAQLEAAAAELRRRARVAMENAAQVTQGTVDGWLIRADLALWDGNSTQAQSCLEKAVVLNPSSQEAQDRLVSFYAQSGQTDRADEQQWIAANLVQTTVTPLLRLVWNRAAKTAWQGARTYLKRAAEGDSTDARVPAYLGVVLAGDDKVAEATAAFQLSLALEEARLALDEPTTPNAVPWLRDPMEFGLAIQARFHLAALAERANNQTAALEQVQAVSAYSRRMTRGFESRQLFTALWPDQLPENGAAVPAPRNAATLMAEAHLRAGKLLAAMGRRDEAITSFRSAAQLGPMRMAGMPRISNGRGDSNFSGIAGPAAAEAQFYLAKELVARGDSEGAQQAMYEIGNGLPEHLRPDLNDLNLAIAHMAPRSARGSPPGNRSNPGSGGDRPSEVGPEGRRSRLAMQQLAGRAKVPPELVGQWELAPENKFLPVKTLNIEANAAYQLKAANEGVVSRGMMTVQPGRNLNSGRPEPLQGQMLLYDEISGQVGTLYHDFTKSQAMEIVDPDGIKYRVRRAATAK